MKTRYLFIICTAALFSSCSSAYRTAQNSDDVYYSQGRTTTTSAAANSDEYYTANPNDQYLMMRVQNPNRWSAFDNYDYGYGYGGMYSPYSYGGIGFYSGYSPWMSFGFWDPLFSYMNAYFAWNGCYNPYYGSVVVVNPHSPALGYSYSQLHPFSRNSYSNSAFQNVNAGVNGNSPRRSGYSFTNRSSQAGYVSPYNRNTNGSSGRSFSRPNYNNQNNYNRPSNSQPARSYTPSNFGGGSMGGGSRSFSRPGKP